MTPTGLEPVTSRLGILRSILMSYGVALRYAQTMPKPGANAQGLFGMGFIALHRLIARLRPRQRLCARIGIELDYIAVGIAGKKSHACL